MGVEYVDDQQQTLVQYARSTALTSGGFGYDATGLLNTYGPQYADFPTTLGGHTTGDGIKMASAIGAELMDMEYIQLHPTGFIDPTDRTAHTKVLGAEIMRGKWSQ